MKNNQSKIKFLFVILFSVMITAAVSAQEKEKESCGNSCCDGKTKMMHQEKMDDSTMHHSKMDHSKMDDSKMDHSSMNHQNMDEATHTTGEGTTKTLVKEVDSNLLAWNTVCPVSGEEIDPEGTRLEYSGKVYGFCCNGCISKFKKDPEKYSKNLSDDGKTFLGTL